MKAGQVDTLEAEIARLGGLGLAELREIWSQCLGSPPRIASTELTRRWLAWELQARVRGGFDAATRRRLRQLAKSFKAEAGAKAAHDPALKPGTVLTREWNGMTHRVVVLEKGFAWNGQNYGSLSEIAFRITNTRWSGPRFFGLRQRAKS